MATVWIPALLRDVTGGEEKCVVAGDTVEEVIARLDARYPGIRNRLCDEGRLRPGISLVVDGEVSRLRLRHPLAPASEIHFVPALSGG